MREQEAAGQQQGGREQQGSGGSHEREAAAAAAAAASGAFTVPAALPATPWRQPKGISRTQYGEKQKGPAQVAVAQALSTSASAVAVPGGGSCMLRWQGGSSGEGRAL